MSKAGQPEKSSENMTTHIAVPQLTPFDTSLLTTLARKEYDKKKNQFIRYKNLLEAETHKLTNSPYDTSEMKIISKSIESHSSRIQKIQAKKEAMIKMYDNEIEKLEIEKQELQVKYTGLKSNPINGNVVEYKYHLERLKNEIDQYVQMYIPFSQPQVKPTIEAVPKSHYSEDTSSDTSSDSSDFDSWDGEFTDTGPAAPAPPALPSPPTAPPTAPPKKGIKMGRSASTVPEPPFTQATAPPVPPQEDRVISEREAYYRWCYDEAGCPPAGPEDLDSFIERKKYRGVSIPQKYYQSSFQLPSYSVPPAAPPAPPRACASRSSTPQKQYTGLQNVTKPPSTPFKKKVTFGDSGGSGGSRNNQPPVILSGKPKEVAPHANIYPIDVCSDGGESDYSLE